MRLTIFTRLMMGYLVIFVLVMAVSVYAILRLYQFNEGTRHILRVDNRILDDERKLTDSILSQIRYEKKYIITKDNVLYDQFLSAKGEFNKYLAEGISMADTSPKKDSLNKAKAHYERYQSLVSEEVEYVRKNQNYSKRWYEQEKEKAADGVLEELENLETYSRQDIYDRMKMLGETGGSARKFAVTMSIVAVLSVVGTSIYITRGITQPLKMLRTRTKEISEGVFNSDLVVPSPPEISDLAKAFNLMCAKLKVLDKLKSDFFSMMSHELRTPLTSIKEGTALLRESLAGGITEKQKRLLTIISEESHRLIGLVNSLLDLSKMEAGMMTYKFEKGNLVPLIDRAVMEIGPLVEAKRITVEAKIGEALPMIKMDNERILQALRNLIGNAVKFTPDGGRVAISARPVNHGVQVSVADTGPGIPAENLNSIFNKFQQAAPAGSYSVKGTGLGLAIVKHIITSHSGKIWAESEPGQGSTFVFVLPV